MGIKKLLCLGIATAVVCTAVPVTAPVQEVRAETEGVENNQDFQIEDGVLKKYLGIGGDVVIPESVTSIGDSAFEGCYELTSVTLPAGITVIGGHAFSYCQGLTDIIIPDGVISIGDGAFYECSGLKSIMIPKSVSSIGNYTF